MGKRVLVTGGAGFIGSFIVDELIRQGHRVRIFDNLEAQVHPAGRKPDYLNTDAEFVLGDVRDYDALKKTVEEMEVIFHEASAVGVGQSQYQIKRYVDVNIGGTANLLDILANNENRVEKLVISGSMSSYGEGAYECHRCGRTRPTLRSEDQMRKGDWEPHCPQCNETLKPIGTTEADELHCNSIYAITKKNQEEMALNIGRTYQIPTVVLRYFNVYGPRQSLSNPYTGVVAIFISLLKNRRAPIVYEDGLQTRDFVSVHDIVRANLLVADTDRANYQVYNVGSGRAYKIGEMAVTLAETLGLDLKPTITNKFRKGDIRHCFSDISRIRTELGFEPATPFKTGMKELIEWSRTTEASDNFDMAARQLAERGLV